MNTSRTRITHLLTTAAMAVLMLVGLAAPSSADTNAHAGAAITDEASDAVADAMPDDMPEIGEVFAPGGMTVAGESEVVCREDWCFQTKGDWSDYDSGGKWATSQMWNASNSQQRYEVWFAPKGELLQLFDRFTDRQLARADVVVTIPWTGVVVDRDSNLYSSFDEHFWLGTPDGSGDIPEGFNVSIRVCVGDGLPCSGWVTGRA